MTISYNKKDQFKFNQLLLIKHLYDANYYFLYQFIKCLCESFLELQTTDNILKKN